MLQKVEGAFRALGLEGGHLLLAVSGGVDSMALLEAAALLAAPLQLRLTVATLDHGLREDAAHDATLVEQASAQRGIRCLRRALNLTGGPGLEARARAARYAALEALREAAGADVVVTAHTASDQAETLLMRLSRGAGVRGAAGIHARRGAVVRPLLTCTREEVRAFVAARGVPFVDDPMNSDPQFLRVRVRQSVLPALEAAAGPGAAERLARFATFAAEDDRLLGDMAEAAYRRAALEGGGLDAVSVRALPPALRRRVLARLLEAHRMRVDAALLALVDEGLRAGRAQVTLPSRHTLLLAGGQVRVDKPRTHAPTTVRDTASLHLGAEPTHLAGTTLELVLRRTPSSEPGWVAQSLCDTSLHEALVRTRRPGDRVTLRDGRSRKVQDLLVDAGIPREARDVLPLVVDASSGRVLCIPRVWPLPGTGRGQAEGPWLESREPNAGKRLTGR